jgi:hypothetical protein
VSGGGRRESVSQRCGNTQSVTGASGSLLGGARLQLPEAGTLSLLTFRCRTGFPNASLEEAGYMIT